MQYQKITVLKDQLNGININQKYQKKDKINIYITLLIYFFKQ